eukprot:MONOS_15325.1-p1 / transcript=MONOS_15325.1 / gene=MONOS_15325 / organism=Monocercomonoides_exilis_PA203 / gene_product=Iron/manganese superoxide dismutase / transcript_product=Iron/manganese superoxide dismutase / location=Mono_scaffold01198:8382-8945(+) / protein_length=188 / sequence_SO=supercontig / SO=protein_coding / is_pseudo=false
MQGMSKELLEDHFQLYDGYITNANKLLATLRNFSTEKEYRTDRRRRLAFEVNGILMHELYFENLTPEETQPSENVKDFFLNRFGTIDNLFEDLREVGSTRGVGWVAVMHDTTTNNTYINWVEEHQLGMLVNMEPLLVLDCWEHAFIKDYGASGRPSFFEASLKRIDWNVVEKRINAVKNGMSVTRSS